MRRNTRKKSKTTVRVVGAAAALAMGAGGLVAANIYASADETGAAKGSAQNQALAAGSSTIDCPDVGQQLKAVPAQARTQVDKELALLDKQVSEAYQRLSTSQQAIQQDANFAQNAIVNPLKDKRKATIDRIVTAIGRVGTKPQGLEALAPCTLRSTGNQPAAGQPSGLGSARLRSARFGPARLRSAGRRPARRGQRARRRRLRGHHQGQAQREHAAQVVEGVQGHLRHQVRGERQQAVQQRQRHRRARCHQRRPPRARLRRQPGQRRLHQRPGLPQGQHQLQEQGRQVVLLLAGAAPAGRHQGVRRRPAGRRSRRQHRPHPDGQAGHAGLRGQPARQGRGDAAAPAHHHR
jgi:hypothetical protein